MIGGKTAALLAACTELGALAAGVDLARRRAFRDFGRALGLAFQAQDDLLGIWGDEVHTGKSSAGDLSAGKKSLPILFGLSQDGAFALRWRMGPIGSDEVAEVAALLEREGARSFTQEHVRARTHQAMQALESADPRGESGEQLAALANDLIHRQV
jgi:geranylgeranyl diphosphate synthase type I